MRKTVPLISLVCTTVLLSVVAVVLFPFDRRGNMVNRLGRVWATIHLKACGIKVVLEGQKNITSLPCIVMCNHQSALDIFALLSSLPLPFKWIAKKELFAVPFLGWALKIGGNIGIDRKNPRKALRALNEAAHRIREGANIVIFPEGTWSPDGSLLPFKKGGFSLALRTGVPIIPVGIGGTLRLQPKGHFFPREKGLVQIRIGPPVPVAEKETRTRVELMREVRSHIEHLAR